MKKSLINVAVVAALGLFAHGAFAQPETNVNLQDVSQDQKGVDNRQRMDLGGAIGPVTATSKTTVGSDGSIDQKQDGDRNTQELLVGTVFGTSGSTAESNVFVRNILQAQRGADNVQLMAIGTVGVNSDGSILALDAGSTNVEILGTVTQSQEGDLNVQRMHIGSVMSF